MISNKLLNFFSNNLEELEKLLSEFEKIPESERIPQISRKIIKFRGHLLYSDDVQQLNNIERVIKCPFNTDNGDSFNSWYVVIEKRRIVELTFKLTFSRENNEKLVKFFEKIKPYILKLSHLDRINIPYHDDEEIPEWLWDQHLY